MSLISMDRRNDKEIPWDLLIESFKGDLDNGSSSELNEWLKETNNQELYKELKVLWLNLIVSKLKSHGNGIEDRMWRKVEKRMRSDHIAPFGSFKTPFTFIAAAVLFVFGFGIALLLPRTEEKDTATDSEIFTQEQSYTSMIGKSKIKLPDGSSVWLNNGAELTYSENRSARIRQATLKGEALFDVNKNPDCPFVVNAQGIKVKVYGTKFNVECQDEDSEVKVALLNGSVEVNNGDKSVMIKPGEMAICSADAENIETKETDVDLETLWTNESLRIEQKSLKEVIRYLEIWYDVKITLSPDIPQNQAYTFTIKKESLGEILSLIARITPIHYEYVTEKSITIDQ